MHSLFNPVFSVTDENKKMCDPWEAKEFLDHADKIPDGTCDHCLPDCTATIYGATVSSAPFKPCDHTNLETSDLCQITAGNQTNPPLWAHKVQTQYKLAIEHFLLALFFAIQLL